MSKDEFQKIANVLKVYKNLINSKEELEAWYSSFRDYEFSLIYDATTEYIKKNQYIPTPAAIINMLPKASSEKKFKPRFETINGKLEKVIQCIRCRDTGIVTWEDNEGRTFGKPCDCPAGHDNYKWGWLDISEQEDYVKRNGHHGEIIGESWY